MYKGNISYVHDNDHEMKYDENLNYINNQKKDNNNFVTNPTHLIFDDYDDSIIEINLFGII